MRIPIKKSLLDWMVVVFVALFLTVFLAFVHARGGTLTGNLLGANAFAPACQSFSNFEKISLGNNPLSLCGARVHSIDFIQLQSGDALIQCNGSTIQGRGGALFVSRISNARVTLQNCRISGFDGFYQNANPVVVRFEN